MVGERSARTTSGPRGIGRDEATTRRRAYSAPWSSVGGLNRLACVAPATTSPASTASTTARCRPNSRTLTSVSGSMPASRSIARGTRYPDVDCSSTSPIVVPRSAARSWMPESIRVTITLW